jgi:hypothetical protein
MFLFCRHLNHKNLDATSALLFAISRGARAVPHRLVTSVKQITPSV